MKIIMLLLVVALAGCGAKSNEEIAKDLVAQKLKDSLPDFNSYKPVSFGNLGTASLLYEESAAYLAGMKVLKPVKDSIVILETLVKTNSSEAYTQRLQQLNDSATALTTANRSVRQAYTPEKLFKINHTYTMQDKAGPEVKSVAAFFMDKDLKKVVKVVKIN